MKLASSLRLACLPLLLALPASAQQFRPQFKLTLDTPPQPWRPSLGASVALEGDVLAVGASTEDSGAGAVHVYRRNAGLWTEEARLVGPQTGPQRFGAALALSQDTLLVSSADLWNGSFVFAFRRTGSAWVAEHQWDFVGSALALAGDRALIGDPLEDLGDIRAGAVHVATRSGSTWTTTVLASPAPRPEGGFGTKVALHGTTAAISEFSRDASGNVSGMVHVYDLSGGSWNETATLNSGRAEDGFGAERIAIDSDTLAVGASHTDVGTVYQAGAVHVFVRAGATWVREAVLVAHDPDTQDWLGGDLGLAGNVLLATNELDSNVNGSRAGAGRVFERSGGVWNETALLTAFEPRAYLELGRCAALSADTAVLGAPRGDIDGNPSGAVYVWARNAAPALAIGSVTPDPIEALYPGTDRTVSIHGTRLDLASSVWLDGTRVDPARWELASSSEIRVDMPQLPNVGWFSVGLHDGAAMDFHAVRIVPPALPRLELGTGNSLTPVVSHGDPTPVVIRVGGPVGSLQVLFGSLSNVPSANRFVSLALGNHFGELIRVQSALIPPRGWVDFESYGPLFLDPGSGTLTAYAQLLQIRPRPFRAGNLVTFLIVP